MFGIGTMAWNRFTSAGTFAVLVVSLGLLAGCGAKRTGDAAAESSSAENKEVVRQKDPRQEAPTWFQKKQEREGSLTWSGASAGGGVWAGRSR